MSDNEQPPLRPANNNPWYCLATIHGEQLTEEVDRELAEKNRLFWVRWIDGNKSDQELQQDIDRHFRRRIGDNSLTLPDPAETVDFSNAHFERTVDFVGFTFRRVTFKSSTFSRSANFRTHFNGYTIFYSSTFIGRSDFKNSHFHAGADFNSARFHSMAEFDAAQFYDDASFSDAVFSQPSYFRRCEFRKTALFRAADFSLLSFEKSKFAERATFAGAIFHFTDFDGTTFSAAADFSYAKFRTRPEFINAKFEGATSFANANFHWGVPDFRGATLHQATEWHGASWPPPPENKSVAQAQVYAYERLKQEMEQFKKHEDEQAFFRKELRARRGLARPLSGEWLLNWSYQVSSEYGSSVGRPIILLAALFAIGLYVFAGTPLTLTAINPGAIPHAAAISFANILPVVPITHDIATAAHAAADMSRLEKVVGVVQTVLGVPLLFLLGLALRNRFRMK